MKIAILGCGWLGFPLGKNLVAKGHQVVGSVTSEAKTIPLSEAGIQPVVLQLNPEANEAILSDFLAADLLVIAIPPRAGKYGDSFHVEQIEGILPSLQKSTIQKVVYISSTSVYPDLGQVATEDSEVIPTHSLIQVENLLKNALGENVTILRCGGLMGQERIPAKYFAGKTINTGAIPVNYVHREDAVGVVTTILEKGIFGETFNVVSPEHPVRKEVYLKNCAELGFAEPIFVEPETTIPYKVIDATKLLNKTGYEFRYANPLDYKYYDVVCVK